METKSAKSISYSSKLVSIEIHTPDDVPGLEEVLLS